MTDLKKLILMSLIPAILTIFFVVKFTVPAVKEYLSLKKQIKTEKSAIKNVKSNIQALKTNKILQEKLNKFNDKLTGFDVEFPEEFKDEILLIDLEIFADETLNKILKVRSLPEKQIKIIDPLKVEPKNKRPCRKIAEQEEIKPVTIMEKPLEINTVAYYSEIIDFVTFLENYQRKINIEGIYTSVFGEDKNSSNPRIEVKIKGSIYKSTVNAKNKITPDKEETQKEKEVTQVSKI